MRILGNIVWLIFGGGVIAIEYIISGILLMLTIVGIPFGIQSVKLGVLALWPFGKKIIERSEPDGCLTIAMNVLWFILGGFWILITHVIFGSLLFVTIVGIPFGQQHFKMVKLTFAPFSKDVVDK